MSRVVLITGVSRELGARLARSLAGRHEVVGLDLTPPRRELAGVTFVRADLRSPALLGILDRHRVETVVHCGLLDDDGVPSAAAAKDANILGTMQLVAACQQSAGVRKLVLRSTGQIYGSSPLDPARYAEDTVSRRPPRSGSARAAREMESFVSGLADRRPDVVVTTLRLANLIGGGTDSPLARWLAMPVVPRPIGFNARLQFLHPADAVTALGFAVDEDLPGIFNVGAPDAICLNQVLRLLGRPAIPLWPATPGLLALGRRARIIPYTSEQVRGVTWGRLLDTTRFDTATGFTTHYSSRRAVEEYAAFGAPGLLSAEAIDRFVHQMTRVLPQPPGVRRPQPQRVAS